MRKISDCVLYQLFLRPFTPEGTLKGAQKMLPHLKDMGVDIVYLCPITYSDEDAREEYWSNRQRECGFHNPQNPYRVCDYYRIDPEYGTDDDLTEFVECAHALDMYVLLDLVYVHCGPNCKLVESHPEMFQKNEDGSIKTSLWHFPLFDFDQTATRDYFHDNMMYFVRRFEVDGYRCDCGDLVPADFWKRCIDDMRAFKPGLVMLNEGHKLENLEAGFDLDYGIGWPGSLEQIVNGEYWDEHEKMVKTCSLSAAEVLRSMKENSDAKPAGKLAARSLENHDIANDAWYHRVEKMVGPRAMESAIAVNYTVKGYPFLYTGVEIADDTRHGLLVNRKYAPNCRVNWSKALTEVGQNRMNFIRAMSALRHENPVLGVGKMEILHHDREDKVMAFVRSDGEKKILVLVSFAKEEQCVCLAQPVTVTRTLYSRGAEGTVLAPFGILVAEIQ